MEVIAGTLLGDGSMRRKRNTLLEINHCLVQRTYVDWKYAILRDLVATPPSVHFGNARRVAYRFTTRSLPELNSFHTLFYQYGAKTIPQIA
ncbi:MAG: hypothetical protein ABR584_09535, partial [Candidatus Baltobacteraceae bacterium]